MTNYFVKTGIVKHMDYGLMDINLQCCELVQGARSPHTSWVRGLRPAGAMCVRSLHVLPVLACSFLRVLRFPPLVQRHAW